MLLFAALFLLAASYAGGIHPVGDSLAVFRVWLGGVAMFLGLLHLVAGGFRLGPVSIIFGLVALVPILPQYGSATASVEGKYSLYQKNMLFNARQPMQMAEDILRQNPDFVTLQEVSSSNRPVLNRLQRTYKSVQFCGFNRIGGTAVLSRWPMVEGSQICNKGNGLAGMQVTTPDGPAWVVSVHLHWPFPYRQSDQLAVILPILETVSGPAVVGGDFNMVPWSSAVRQVERKTGTNRAGQLVSTFNQFNGWVPLPIDHVLTPGGNGQLTTRPHLTSDHLGVLVSFDLY